MVNPSTDRFMLSDIGLLVARLQQADQAPRLARASGWLLMLAGVVVVLFGFLLNHAPTMVEGTLVAILALFAGWGRSRLAAVFLVLVLGLGLAGGVLAGIEIPTLAFLIVAFLVALRLMEACFRFR